MKPLLHLPIKGANKQHSVQLKERNIPVPEPNEEPKLATYIELKEKATKLLAEAEVLRQTESLEVIADIKAKMQTYGLTIQDLQVTPVLNKSHKSTAPIKYRGPNGEGWSGGRGVKPAWIKEALRVGQDIEKFRV